MKRTRLILLIGILALLPAAPTRAGDGDESLRDELIRRLDARLAKEMARVRAELVAEIDRALAERSGAELPEGYRDLLEEIRRLRGEVESLPDAPAAEPPAPAPALETLLGATVEPAPALLRAQLDLPEGARFVRAVPEGSAAAAAGFRAGDVVLEVGERAVTILRQGKRITLSRESGR